MAECGKICKEAELKLVESNFNQENTTAASYSVLFWSDQK